MSNFTTPNFFEFVIAKHIPFETLEEDFANFVGEDSFNSETAEAALELAFDLYPDDQAGKDDEDQMELRHNFVDEFLEYARCVVIKKWASNLGMYTKEQAQSNVDTQVQVSKEYWTKKIDLARERSYNDGFDDGVNETLKKHRKMSSYQFSAWKLGVKPNDPEQDRIMEQVEDSVFYNAKYPDDEFDPCDLDVTIDNSSMKDDTLPSEYQPQDSEDECWEQMIAQQRANNNHSQDI